MPNTRCNCAVTLLYWKWPLHPSWPLRSFFPLFPEQLLKDLVSWGSPDEYSMIDRFLVDAFQGTRFLTGVCVSMKLLNVDLWQYRVCCIRSGVIRCTLFMVPLPGPNVPVLVTHSAMVSHRYTYSIHLIQLSDRAQTHKWLAGPS